MKNKRLVIAISGILLLIVACILASTSASKYEQRKKIEQDVEDLNKLCPQSIDEATTLTNADFRGDTVIYTYKVESDSLGYSMINETEVTLKQKHILQEQCTALFISKESSIYNDALRESIDYGVSLKYVYQEASQPKNYRAYTISNEELKQLHKDFDKLDRRQVACEYIKYTFTEINYGIRKGIEENDQQGIKTSFKYENDTLTINYIYTPRYIDFLKKQAGIDIQVSNSEALDLLLDRVDLNEVKRGIEAYLSSDKLLATCARAANTQFVVNIGSSLSNKKVSSSFNSHNLLMGTHSGDTYQNPQP